MEDIDETLERLCDIRGPEGILIGLAQRLSGAEYEDNDEERPMSASATHELFFRDRAHPAAAIRAALT